MCLGALQCMSTKRTCAGPVRDMSAAVTCRLSSRCRISQGNPCRCKLEFVATIIDHAYSIIHALEVYSFESQAGNLVTASTCNDIGDLSPMSIRLAPQHQPTRTVRVTGAHSSRVSSESSTPSHSTHNGHRHGGALQIPTPRARRLPPVRPCMSTHPCPLLQFEVTTTWTSTS
jgi:hypothetical protein